MGVGAGATVRAHRVPLHAVQTFPRASPWPIFAFHHDVGQWLFKPTPRSPRARVEIDHVKSSQPVKLPDSRISHPNLARSVLSCLNADFCKYRLIFKGSLRSTNCNCSILSRSKFQQSNIFKLGMFLKFESSATTNDCS